MTAVLDDTQIGMYFHHQHTRVNPLERIVVYEHLGYNLSDRGNYAVGCPLRHIHLLKRTLTRIHKMYLDHIVPDDCVLLYSRLLQEKLKISKIVATIT